MPIAPGMVGFAVAGCPTRRSPKAVSACGPRSPPWVFRSPKADHDQPLTRRLPKEGRITTCRSRLRCSLPWGSSMPRRWPNMSWVGELGLDGRVAVSLGCAEVSRARRQRQMGLICPGNAGGGGCLAGQVEAIAAIELAVVTNHLKGQGIL